MANLKVEEQLEQLDLLRSAPLDVAIAGLRKGLADRVNVVIAKAARIVAARQIWELVPDLLKAFDLLLSKPDRDPQCWGKNEIARALVQAECSSSDPFLRGSVHVQMEPVWGRKVDTAGTLRGTCLLALVQVTDLPRSDVSRRLVAALTDAEHVVRTEAVRGLEQMGGEECELVLRLKASMGDEEPQVTGQALESTLKLEGERGLPFVVTFLKSEKEGVPEETALTLGSSHLPAALNVLTRALAECHEESLRRAILTAISTTRSEDANEFLFELLATARAADAGGILEALALHKQSAEVVERVKKLVEGRQSKRLEEQFEGLFGRR